MATKSKNIKYSKGTKTAALLIAVIMFFLSGYFANLFIRGFADYNAYDKGVTHYTHTSAFRSLMNDIELYYISEYEADKRSFNSLEEFKNSEQGRFAYEEFDESAKTVSDAYDVLENSEIEVYVTSQNSYRYLYPYKNFVYLFDYRGNIMHEDSFFAYEISRVYPDDETTHESGEPYTYVTVVESKPYVENSADSEVWVDINGNGRYKKNASSPVLGFYQPGDGQPPLEVQDIANALNTIGAINGYTCYGESTKSRFLEEIENEREQFIRDMYQSANSFRSYDYILNQIKSINYAIITKDGKVSTNCGVSATDTEAQIIEKLGGDIIESTINGSYKLLKSIEYQEVPSVYRELHDMLFGKNGGILSEGSYLFSNPRDEVSAYFSYGFQDENIDLFTLSYYAYEDFANSPINNPTICLVLFALFFFIACAACIYLLAVAGKTADGIKINFYDKIPAEINWAIGAAVAFAAAFGAVVTVIGEALPTEIVYNSALFNYDFTKTLLVFASKTTNIIIGCMVCVFFMILTAVFASFIRNIRNKSFWKHTLCYQIFRFAGWILKNIWKFLKFIFRPFGNAMKKLTDRIRYILTCDYSKGEGKKFRTIAYIFAVGFMVATILYYSIGGMIADYEEFVAFLMYFFGIIGDIAILGFVILVIVSLDRIMACVSQTREGNFDGKIDTKFMPPFMRRFAEDILSMQDGLQTAVESAVKDQRMKAELITNVSHDLKTPLTSIVTYVDLLKKCDVDDEIAQKYITVLDEKAARMKKLIEDLVEASKASSGAIEIHSVKVNLCEFAAQAVGEHEDELKNYNIDIVLKTPTIPVTVTADSQKTSRIVENLFSNIRKYTMEGTRVYVEVADGTDFGSVVFKNISKYPLDVSADELTQRFVRGDASRSGEGSGLGLSIAQNLCELQKGRFRVEVDGDLFKVTLSLPKA